MPSSYTPPDVYVTQVRKSAVGTARLPSMPVVVIGVARQVESRVEAEGLYNPALGLETDLPALTPGALVAEPTIEVLFDVTYKGKRLGLFQLTTQDFSTTADTTGNVAGLSIPTGLALDVSLLSARNNNQPNSTTDDDRGDGTPDGVFFADAAVDFLAKGTSVDGSTYISIDSPASMAGTYRVLRMIPLNGKVRELVVEKVTFSGSAIVADLVQSYTQVQNPLAPTTTEVVGAPATHETILFDGKTNATAVVPTEGIGVKAVRPLRSSTGAAVTAWGTTEINGLLGASTILRLPGRVGTAVSNANVVFAPSSVSGTADAVARAQSYWRDLIANAKVGNWIRVGFDTATSINTGAITNVNRTTNVITVTTTPGAGAEGRTLTVTGGSDFDGVYTIQAVAGTAVTVGEAIPGVDTTSTGSTVTAQVTSLRDFKIVAVDTAGYALTLNALGSADVGDVIIDNTAPGISSLKLYEVLAGSSDKINGAGDYITYTANGIEQYVEIQTATPSKLLTATAYEAFPSTSLGAFTGVTISVGPVINGLSGLTASALVGKYVTVSGAASAANNGVFPITANTTTSITYTNASAVPTETANISLFDAPNFLVTLRRGIPYRGSTAGYDLRKQITSDYTASVLVSYVAERRDLPLSGVLEIQSRNDNEDTLGPAVPENPLAFGVEFVARSGLMDGNRSVLALATNGDSVSGFLEALDTLGSTDPYHIVPLTQNPAILSAYAEHVKTQSDPRNRHERFLWASTALPSTETVIPTAGNAAPTGTFLSATTFQSSTAAWGLVSDGQNLKVLVSPNTAQETVELERRILSINTATNTVTFLDEVPAEYVGTTRAFRVDTFPLTKDEQAEAWRDEARSYNSFRVTMVRPDQIEVDYTDETVVPPVDRTVTVPSFYLCATMAGVAATRSPSAPMTNVPIPGIRRVIHANDYFSPGQLDVIAEGGNNVVIQPSRTSLPYSRHQLTTEMLTTVTRELSITSAVDYTAKFFRNSLRPYIGNKNITKQYLNALRGTGEAVGRRVVRDEILNACTIVSLKQIPDEPDAVAIEVEGEPLYPGNRIYVTINI